MAALFKSFLLRSVPDRDNREEAILAALFKSFDMRCEGLRYASCIRGAHIDLLARALLLFGFLVRLDQRLAPFRRQLEDAVADLAAQDHLRVTRDVFQRRVEVELAG